MGLKLKWFRRRITFDGIPPAPERSIRRKEAATGTVTGVYRQSTNFEDYIEPVRTSFWEPPPQAIARATYRTSNPTTTSTNSPSSSSFAMTRGGTIVASTNSIKPSPPPPPAVVPVPTTISSVSRPPQPTTTSTDTEDKIGRTGNGALRYDTPPEPTYTPPQPPVRKGLGKTKSLGNLANGTSSPTKAGSERYPREDGNSSEDSSSGYVTSYELRSPHSVEVLSAPSPPRTPKQDVPTRVPPVTAIPRTTSSNSLPSKGDPTVSPQPQRKQMQDEPDYIVPPAGDPEPIYDSFDAIFERVKVRNKPASPSSEGSAPGTPSPTASPPTPRQKEPPRAVVATSVPNPAMSPPQPKSILKKRAPAPPTVVEAMSSMVTVPVSEPVMTIPTPPPRSTRGVPTVKDIAEIIPEPANVTVQESPPRMEEDIKMIPQVAHSVDDDSDDEDFNWDFVQRHRSSINQTMAAQTQIDPEVLRNAPASLLQQVPTGAPSQYTRNPSEPIAQPRTLRGMRNQRARPQAEAEPGINRGQGDSSEEIVRPNAKHNTPRARASDSNCSETSA